MDRADSIGAAPSLLNQCGAPLGRRHGSSAAVIGDARRPPHLALPYPLSEYLEEKLSGDYAKITMRLLRAAQWERGRSRCGRYELDAGEALIEERSDKLWGSIALDRNVSAAGRRALVRRVLERLEADGIIACRRAAQGSGPKSGPMNGPRRGPTPTVVRFLKFREILWPTSVETAQDSAQETARKTPQARGPILPVSPPGPSAAAAAREDDAAEYPALTKLADALSDQWQTTVLLPRDGCAELEAAVAKLGFEKAFAECHEDAVAAHQNRRIEGPPTSLGFSPPRLLRAASRLARAAGATP
jgi:hypothetical protein